MNPRLIAALLTGVALFVAYQALLVGSPADYSLPAKAATTTGYVAAVRDETAPKKPKPKLPWRHTDTTDYSTIHYGTVGQDAPDEVTYDSELAAHEVPEQRDAILCFCATWCGPCRKMKPVIAELKEKGYPIETIDIDQEPTMARAYRVGGVPCFIARVGGQERARLSGIQTTDRLARFWYEAKGVAFPMPPVIYQQWQSVSVIDCPTCYGGGS